MGFRFKNTLINFAKNNRDVNTGDFDGYAVTADDANDLPNGPTRAIYVTGAGNVAVNLNGGGTATLTGLSAGQLLMISASRVLATGTTATGISALY